MAYKQFMLDEQTPVTIYKRKSSRGLRLSITAKGDIRVSIPIWAPYRSGLEFARSRKDWIESQKPTSKFLVHGQSIGKAHRLVFIENAAASRPKSRILANQVTITHSGSHLETEVQNVAERASIRALRTQAETLLPKRLKTLSELHGFEYKSVKIKLLKSRWGSCDQHQNIVLNLYLMQLPWHCIDYVVLHELVHTKILKHGPEFWKSMEEVLPSLKQVRKEMRKYQTVLS